MKYEIKRIPGGYRASLYVPAGDGRQIIFTGSALEREVRAFAKRRAQVSGFFGSIGRMVSRMTKSKALRQAVGTATRVLKSPAVTTTLTAINPALGIGLKTSLEGLTAAEKLLGNATKGRPGSAKRIAARATIKAAQAVARRDDRKAKTAQLARVPQIRKALGASSARSQLNPAQSRIALNYLVQLLGL